MRDNTSFSTKISSDETKSSFKPYKQSPEKEEEMTEKSGFRSPSKENTSRSSSVETKEERSKGLQYSESEGHCGYVHSQQNRVCGMAVDAGQGQTVHSLHKECGGSCNVHPSNLIPFKGAMPYPPPMASPEHAALKSHGVPTSNVSSMYPQCACVFCTPHGENAAAQALSRPLHGPATPYMDYLQRTICRDANCTNCRTPMNPYGLQAPVQQCGPHCMQCDNMTKPTEQSAGPYSCYYPHSLAMFKSVQEEGHPYVCNWVSGAKHCGKSFATSEDLFQHLRTHTQLGNNSVSPPIPQPSAPCTIHGCPCKLQQGPVQSSFHSSRYRPYYFKPSLVPGPPPASINCYSNSPYGSLHSLAYDPHRLFK